MAESELDKWKKRCLALAEEVDDWQTRCERMGRRLQKVLARLVCAFEGQSQGLDPYLVPLREALRGHVLDENRLENLDTSSDVLLRVSEQIRCEQAARDQDLHSCLLRLLQAVEIPPALTDLGEQVSACLKQGEATKEAIEGTARLLAEVYVRLRQERAELEVFLGQLTARLQLLTVQAQDVGQLLQASEGDRSMTLTAQVDHLRASTLGETSLEALKLIIAEKLDALSAQLHAFLQEEAKRNAQAAEQIGAMTERLQELEQESYGLRQKLKQAYHQARYDPVTDLPNRKATDESLAQEFARWQRFKQPLSVLLWDLDHFKQINDRFGHQAGDKALRVVGQILREGIRAVDFVGRYGGEEFLMLLPGTELAGATKLAEKLREAVKRCGFHSRGEPVPITVSCGLTCARAGDTLASLFERADQALYQAKRTGRDRCVGV
ncbi:MAG: diguanylate cyclase [Methylohalobius sp.]|nr:diguanylate cyclase [Methylohalobius sp.]